MITFSISRVALVGSLTTMMLLVLGSYPFSTLSFLQQQQAQATSFEFGKDKVPRFEFGKDNFPRFEFGKDKVPPAYIIIDGKTSKLQLENGDPTTEDATGDYTRPPQGTISFGERFQLQVPQFPLIFKDVQSSSLFVCGGQFCNDDFHVRQELVKTKDIEGFLFRQTYTINSPGSVGDGFTASDNGFKIFLLWTLSFTDGSEQTYLATVLLKGDPCGEHGWVYSRGGTTCSDPNA